MDHLRTGTLPNGRLALEAGPKTDWFVDPSGDHDPILSAQALVVPTDGDFILSARVTVSFASDFDAGALVVRVHDGLWAKLCFEFSPQHEPMVVSVVTREVSDDANGFIVEASSVWLRVARLGDAFAFHASLEGKEWRFVRHFSLARNVDVSVGFEAQSPTGEGCEVVFDEISFARRRLADLRDGS